VQVAAGTCGAAAGDGTTDDTATLQCHLTYMYSTYGGGSVYFPPGDYLVSGGGLTVQGGVSIVGAGQSLTAIQSINADSQVIAFDAATCNHSSMTNVSVYGYQNAASGTNAVVIGTNCPVILRDDTLLGGYSGLYNLGIDSLIENCFIAGYTASIVSNGANWYVRDKIDLPGGYGATYAFWQGDTPASATSAENHLVQCDFSGAYTYSVFIDDATNGAITVFDSSVMSSPILISGAKWTNFSNDELGASITANAGVVTVTGSYGFGGISVSGSATLVGGNNYNITL
jgi:hypothetical protein